MQTLDTPRTMPLADAKPGMIVKDDSAFWGPYYVASVTWCNNYALVTIVDEDDDESVIPTDYSENDVTVLAIDATRDPIVIGSFA